MCVPHTEHYEEVNTMNDKIYAEKVKRALQDCIAKLEATKWMFVRDPERDFTRNRVITFEEFIKICLQMEGSNLQNELLSYFEFDETTPTKSAFCQQRMKVLPEALEFLFRLFTEILIGLDTPKTFKGYRLLACDGSDINIPYNLDDPESYHQNGDKKGYNQLHLNAFFDILNGIYIDCVLDSDRKSHERAAFNTMLDRLSQTISSPAIIIADRGYESYNLFGHLIRSGQKFMIRLKDDESNGIISTWDFPYDENHEFDCDIETILTSKQTNEIKENRSIYTFVSKNKFDLFDADNPFFDLKLRILCIQVAPGIYDFLATNLDREEFPFPSAKELYHFRWGVETSFRDLKYTIDILHFHGKKRLCVEQEAWAKLTVFNFCEAIARHITIPNESKNHKRKHTHKINFATAACICKAVLRHHDGEIDMCKLISRFLIPIRPGRSAPRKMKPQSAKSFLYRGARA